MFFFNVLTRFNISTSQFTSLREMTTDEFTLKKHHVCQYTMKYIFVLTQCKWGKEISTSSNSMSEISTKTSKRIFALGQNSDTSKRKISTNSKFFFFCREVPYTHDHM